MTDTIKSKRKILVGDSYVDVVIPQLRQTINSQAEVIAELETVRVHLMKEIEEIKEMLNDLKQSLKDREDD